MQRNALLALLAAALIVGAGYYFFTGKADAPTTTDPSSDEMRNRERVGDPLVGVWQSKEDARFSRTFYADGSFTDRYEGEPSATQPGEWKRTAGTNADLSSSLEAGLDGLELVIDGDVYRFGIIDVTVDSLELVYLDRGGVLTFTRVR